MVDTSKMREIVEIVLRSHPNPDNLTVDDVNLSGIGEQPSVEAYHHVLKERIQDALYGVAKTECRVCGLKLEQVPPGWLFIDANTGAMLCTHPFGVPAANVPDWSKEKG
jgi:hypothetical protein